jgi:hypothetical protein
MFRSHVSSSLISAHLRGTTHLIQPLLVNHRRMLSLELVPL